MDDHADLLEGERSERSVVDIRGSAEQPTQLTLDSLSLLRLTDTEQVKHILKRYVEMNVPKEHLILFQQHLCQRIDSWFVAVGDVGLIYLTNIVVGFTANFSVLFWDKKFGANRRELVRGVLATAFSEFDLSRVTAFVPITNKPLAEVEMRKTGFVREGVLRKAWRDEVDVDLVVFGLLRGEVGGWPVVEHLQIELR